jgi:hypothetical protein
MLFYRVLRDSQSRANWNGVLANGVRLAILLLVTALVNSRADIIQASPTLTPKMIEIIRSTITR